MVKDSLVVNVLSVPTLTYPTWPCSPVYLQAISLMNSIIMQGGQMNLLISEYIVQKLSGMAEKDFLNDYRTSER